MKRLEQINEYADLTPLQIARKRKIPIEDRIKALLRPEVLGEDLPLVVAEIVDATVKRHCLTCGVPTVEVWAQNWLSGIDRTEASARAAGDAAWSASGAATWSAAWGVTSDVASAASDAASAAGDAAWSAASAASAAWSAAWGAAWVARDMAMVAEERERKRQLRIIKKISGEGEILKRLEQITIADLTPLQIARKRNIPIEDRIKVLLRPEVLGDDLPLVLAEIVDATVKTYALQCGVPMVEAWARKWLSGDDRTEASASVAWDAAWSAAWSAAWAAAWGAARAASAAWDAARAARTARAASAASATSDVASAASDAAWGASGAAAWAAARAARDAAWSAAWDAASAARTARAAMVAGERERKRQLKIIKKYLEKVKP